MRPNLPLSIISTTEFVSLDQTFHFVKLSATQHISHIYFFRQGRQTLLDDPISFPLSPHEAQTYNFNLPVYSTTQHVFIHHTFNVRAALFTVCSLLPKLIVQELCCFSLKCFPHLTCEPIISCSPGKGRAG